MSTISTGSRISYKKDELVAGLQLNMTAAEMRARVGSSLSFSLSETLFISLPGKDLPDSSQPFSLVSLLVSSLFNVLTLQVSRNKKPDPRTNKIDLKQKAAIIRNM